MGDFTNYGEIRIKKVPIELKRQLKTEAKKLGIDERSLMLWKLWGLDKAPYEGHYKPPEGDARDPHKTPGGPEGGATGPQARQKSPREKFEPPTVLEAQKEIDEKKHHFSAEEFVAYYATRGWKLKSGVSVKDWRQAMVTWEAHWRERNGVVSETKVSTGQTSTVKCGTCGDQGLVHQDPRVGGPRLVPCPQCRGGAA